MRPDRRPALRHTLATASSSSSVTKLPITRTATVISVDDRIPSGPVAARNRGNVSSRANRRAMENPRA